jgi:hypothetical protein
MQRLRAYLRQRLQAAWRCNAMAVFSGGRRERWHRDRQRNQASAGIGAAAVRDDAIGVRRPIRTGATPGGH